MSMYTLITEVTYSRHINDKYNYHKYISNHCVNIIDNIWIIMSRLTIYVVITLIISTIIITKLIYIYIYVIIILIIFTS